MERTMRLLDFIRAMNKGRIKAKRNFDPIDAIGTIQFRKIHVDTGEVFPTCLADVVFNDEQINVEGLLQ